MVSRYRFISCHAVQRTQLTHKLDLVDPSWSWAVRGNGALTAKIAVPEDPTLVARLKGATEPLVAAVYVQDRNNEFPWGGPVMKRTWRPGRSQIVITAMEWRTWLYNLLRNPGPTTDYFFTASPPSGQEQLDLARLLLLVTTGGGGLGGCPPYTQDSNVSGKMRELNFYASQSKYIGELLDTMSNRDGGFEWTLESRPDPTDRLPRLHFRLDYPERSVLRSGITFKATSGGSNFSPGDVELDASSARNQFLATGSGTPPDMLYAFDNDTYNISNNNVLRMDGNANYNTVQDRKTLAEHARRAILFFRAGVQNISGTHTFEEIDPDSYDVGDRVPMLIQDRWESISVPAARVIEKTINYAGAGTVQFRLDLSDATMPEIDAGGAV